MNRSEFMARLEKLLTGISEEERSEALQYYEDYFDDAGPANEQKVIQELGSPEKVAATIRAGMEDNGAQSGEFTENGYVDDRFEEKETPVTRKDQGVHEEQSERKTDKPWTSRILKLVLVIAIIAACPFLIPIAVVVVIAVLVIIAVAFGFFAVLVVLSAAVAFLGVMVIIAGITQIGAMLPSALATVGAGLLLLAVGLIAVAATVKLCIVMYPALFRMIVNACRKLIYGRRKSG